MTGQAFAAITAAGVGSVMGGASGTVAGAAIVAVVTTIGESVYERSLARSRDNVRGRIQARRATGAPGDPAGAGSTDLAPEGPGEETVSMSPAVSGHGSGGATRMIGTDDASTRAVPGGAADATRVERAADPATRVERAADPATRVVGSEDATRLATTAAPLDGGSTRRRPNWRRYGVLAATGVAIFLVAMLAITGIERVKGSPLSGGESGTSVGAVLGGDTTKTSATTSEETTTSADTGDSAPDGPAATSTAGREPAPQSTRRTTTTSRAPDVVPSNLLGGN